MKNKPTRGTAFYNTATHENVWFWHAVDSTTYVVCPDEKFQAEVYRADVSDLKPIHKPKKRLNAVKPANKKSVTQLAKDIATKDFKNNLNIWFADQIPNVPYACENCGLPLMAYTSEKKRFVTAHILPKSPNGGFPAVSTHPLNRMFLGVSLFSKCNCHDLWDNSDADQRAQMPCHTKAVHRFLHFREYLNPKELIKACEYLKIAEEYEKN